MRIAEREKMGGADRLTPAPYVKRDNMYVVRACRVASVVTISINLQTVDFNIH